MNVVVGFLLTPFILHRLGDEAYGLWVLVFSFAGYYGVLDLGISSAVIRYVARFSATHDHEQLARFVNTILFLFSCVALFLLLVTLIASWYVGDIFRISPALHTTARILFLLVGSMVALQFPLGVFAGILEGLQEFWWENFVSVTGTLLRAALIVIVLSHGLGLLSISLITVGLSLLSRVAYILIVRKRIPLHFVPRFSDRATLKEIIHYSSMTFTSVVAGRLTSNVGTTIIAVFLSAATVTPFAIATKLITYMSRLVQASSTVFTPMASHFDAKGDSYRLRQIFIVGNRACAILAFPFCSALLILGKSVITVWVGARYAWSYSILAILIVPYTLQFAQLASPKILYGTARHRTLGMARLIEGIANVTLSVILLRYYGIWGVALGTAIPKLCSAIFFLPWHVCQILHVRLRTFLVEAYLWPLALCVPMTLIILLLHHFQHTHTFLRLFEQVSLGGFVYGFTLLGYFLLKEPEGIRIRKRFAKSGREALNR